MLLKLAFFSRDETGQGFMFPYEDPISIDDAPAGYGGVSPALLAHCQQGGLHLRDGSVVVDKVFLLDPGDTGSTAQLKVGGKHGAEVRCVVGLPCGFEALFQTLCVLRPAGDAEQQRVNRFPQE